MRHKPLLALVAIALATSATLAAGHRASAARDDRHVLRPQHAQLFQAGPSATPAGAEEALGSS